MLQQQMYASVWTSLETPRHWQKGTVPFDTNPSSHHFKASLWARLIRPLISLKWHQNCKTCFVKLTISRVWFSSHPQMDGGVHHCSALCSLSMETEYHTSVRNYHWPYSRNICFPNASGSLMLSEISWCQRGGAQSIGKILAFRLWG